MTKTDQLEQLEKAFENFVQVVHSLSPTGFLASLGDWTPRDILAHLVGWNRNTLVGCQQIQSGLQPFYHVDGPNDYRTLNAEIITRFNSIDRPALLRELVKGKDLLVSYLEGVDEHDWNKDFGAQHYRGGPATISRAIESLTNDYVNHAAEIARQHVGIKPAEVKAD
jgi:hypothetical protein